MATIQEIEAAIRVADKKGNRADVLALGEARARLLSQQAPTAQPQQKNNFAQETARQVGLAGRAMVGGAAQMAEPFTEPVRYLMNKALPGNPIHNLESSVDQLMTSAGVPEPETPEEKITQSVGRFGTGFAGGFGVANKADDAVLGLLNLSKRAKSGVAPTQELRNIANKAYTLADESGVVIKSDGFGEFVNNATEKLVQEGFDRTLHPRAAAALKRLTDAAEGGNPLTLQEVEILRRVVGIAGRSVDADEVRVAGILKRELDNFTDNLGPSSIHAGDPKTATAALKTARDAWQRFSKSTEIENAIEIAKVNAGANFTRAGLEHALRIQFKQMARNIVKNGPKGWTPKEVAAIKHIASGGKMGNAMRTLGKLAPTGVISGAASLGGGYAMGGPLGSAALAGIGYGAKAIATKMTENNVARLSELVTRGAPLPKGFDPPDWLLPWVSGTAFGADTQE